MWLWPPFSHTWLHLHFENYSVSSLTSSFTYPDTFVHASSSAYALLHLEMPFLWHFVLISTLNTGATFSKKPPNPRHTNSNATPIAPCVEFSPTSEDAVSNYLILSSSFLWWKSKTKEDKPCFVFCIPFAWHRTQHIIGASTVSELTTTEQQILHVVTDK